MRLRNPVGTLGNFDGVHLGHRALLEATRDLARELSGEPLVITFEPHPRLILRPEAGLHLLTTFEEKLRLIEEAGISSVLVIPFDREVADLPAEEFVEEYLVYGLGLKGLVVGFNYRFGRGRGGDQELLKHLGERYGFRVRVIPPRVVEGQVVSSTLIRELLEKGEVRRAALFLGRPYFLSGRVIRGEARGRTLGFPTANLEPPPEKLLPARGVYAVRVCLKGKIFFGVMNIGEKPTFGGHRLSLEVHIFEFESDIYGERLSVEFIDFLRPERKFPSPAALAEQIIKDCQKARELLKL
ncbi:bifunctional riboflavin kinase/FAD synthetase [Thermosulfurimonas sp. F29]|uniref:bifunctional riboflavin kinase/FAD synthetase n=1 Tax=Thermosulfurimonas sp. F29 TaxID=2867247 RepID=UPI00210334EB|nr:bifunctional riboflavin kinase/FAD synthetase [Thermosulfurimonas sp. F29]